MPEIARFSLKDRVGVSVALRSTGSSAASREEVGDRIVHYQYDHCTDKTTGGSTCVLVRLFKTPPYGDPDEDLQASASGILKTSPSSPEMRCFYLPAGAGTSPGGELAHTSAGYTAIPLPGEHFIESLRQRGSS